MDAAVKQLWVVALRSGAYRQGVGALKVGPAYCCLGVLCDLFGTAEDGGGFWGPPDYEGEAFVVPNCEPEQMALPGPVMRWAGLTGCDPMLGNNVASQLNDSGVTFGDIADLIEANL